MAKKNNLTEDEIDITVFEWVQDGSLEQLGSPGCGGCHPGGGGLEFDREGKRYDKNLLSKPSLRNSLDGDYYKSRWDKTGVIEADCFLCHIEEYNFNARNSQLKLWNFKWAAIEASGIGVVNGTVAKIIEKDGKKSRVLSGITPKVTYNTRLFNQNGQISLDLEYPPPSRNCTFCHAISDRKKRGFSWNDADNPDIHNLSGLECVSCHRSIDNEHNFAKGDENVSTVRDDLDGKGMHTCRECHEKGILGATIPKHDKIRPNHMEKLACETCHIPKIRANGGSTFDVTAGEMVNYGHLKNEANTTLEEKLKSPFVPIPLYNEWIPRHSRNYKTNKIEPVNPFPQGLMYTNKDADGKYYPLFIREIKKAYTSVQDKITKQPYDKGPFKGKPKLFKKDEIKLYLTALKSSLKGNKRFKAIDPQMHFFGTLYYLDENGELRSGEDKSWVGKAEAFNINHNVAPASEALGAGGCLDCHGLNGQVFRTFTLTRIWGEDGKPVFVRNGRLFGCNPFSFYVNMVHQAIITPYASLFLIIVGFFLMIHYTGRGPKGADLLLEPATIQRFSVRERWAHFLRMITFIGLAITGGIFFYNSTTLLNLFFDSQKSAVNWHIFYGIVFIAASIYSYNLWANDAKFAEYDKKWIETRGGYFSRDEDVEAPAGRLNAGQKVAFWWILILTAIMGLTGILMTFKTSLPLTLSCLLSTIHGLFAVAFIATILGHAYLGTLANPGTWRTMIDGMVTEKWAKKHHSEWYKELKEKTDK